MAADRSSISVGKRKRPRRSRDEEETRSPIPKTVRGNEEVSNFREGAIRMIRLHNFLTFDDVVIEPSAQLNVIVGPNGTGKSSLVCAMCIGLCGHTSLLGRAKELKDFVKIGKAKEGFVEITLHHDSGNHPIIKRMIYKDRNSSKWFINGRDKKEQEVKDLVKKFNIQLDNKCQFLPQDRVVEFARLDKYQLLEETEKAIGSEDMYKLHQELKKLKDTRIGLQSRLDMKQKQLEETEHQNQLLERDVRRIRTRKDSLHTIKYLKWKKSWIDYEEVRLTFAEKKNERKQIEKSVKDLHTKHKPLKDKLKEKEAAVQRFQQLLKTYSGKIRSAEKDLSSQGQHLKDLREEEKSICQDYVSKQNEEKRRLEIITELQGQIESFKGNLESLPKEESIKPQLTEKNKEIQSIASKMLQVQSSQRDFLDQKSSVEERKKQFTDDLSHINDVYKQRLSKLAEKDRDTYEAMKWLKENRNLFKKKVYDPILALLHIKDLNYAKQIENFFSGKDLYAFIFESSEDHELFASKVRDEKDLRVNMVIAPTTPYEHFKCGVPMSNLREFGFRHMLADLIEAPPPVLAYFCQYHYLHNVPLGDQLSSKQITSFTTRHAEIQRFYTKDQMYIVRRSRYRNESITKSDHLRQCQFFLSSVDEVAKENLISNIKGCDEEIAKIDAELSQLKEAELALRQKDGKLRKEKNDLREKLTERKKLCTNIEKREIQIKKLEDSPIDLEKEKSKMKAALISCTKKKVDYLKKISDYSKVYKNEIMSKIYSQLNWICADKKRQEFYEKFSEVTEELKEAELSITQAKSDEEALKRKAQEMMKKAKDLTGVSSPDQLSHDIREMFKDYPEDSDEIEELIHQHQTQVEMCSSIADAEMTLQRYEQNEELIKKLHEEIESDQNDLDNHEEYANRKKRSWLEPLEKMIGEVNTRFTRYFSEMKCAGEVSLLQHENDYSKFGVLIRVKFRSEDELHVLDAQHQSGGERSVSTMLYLMALQDITKCSFRVVDEINQGMDSNNERSVFDQIVSTVGRAGTAQYFLLTPKLLQNLKFSPAVTVHIIHNGPKMTPSWQRNLFI